jgi:glycosyltransferase involved in cell wall biosynthesis
MARDIPKIAALIRDLRPDVVHAKNQVYVLAGLRAGYPTVLTTHGLSFLHHGHRFNSRSFLSNLIATNLWYLTLSSPMASTLKERFQRLIATNALILTLRRLKAVIVVSAFDGNRIAALTNAKMYYIPNPVDERYFEIPNREVQGRLLLVGRVSRGKGILDAVQTLNMLRDEFPQAHLHVAGSVLDQQYAQAVESYIAAHDLRDRVRLLGLIDSDRLSDEYAQCSVLVMPSTHENSPNALGQAMAAGKPAVAYSVGGIPQRLRDGVTGFLVPYSEVDTLARRISDLLQDDASRAQMGHAARQVAQEEFNPTIVARKTLQVYEELLNGGSTYLA